MVDYGGIGARIRALRKERNMTQEELAEAAGIGATHVSHIENGTTKLSVQTLIAIINALECSADELLCIEIAQAKTARNSWIKLQAAFLREKFFEKIPKSLVQPPPELGLVVRGLFFALSLLFEKHRRLCLAVTSGN